MTFEQPASDPCDESTPTPASEPTKTGTVIRRVPLENPTNDSRLHDVYVTFIDGDDFLPVPDVVYEGSYRELYDKTDDETIEEMFARVNKDPKYAHLLRDPQA